MWSCDFCAVHLKKPPAAGPDCPDCRRPLVQEFPAVFTGESVGKIGRDLKTQTRRVVDESRLFVTLPHLVTGDWPFSSTRAKAGRHKAMMNPHGAVSVQVPSPGGPFQTVPKGEPSWLGVKPDEFEWCSPYGQPGDRIWVKETFSEVPWRIANDAAFDSGRIRAVSPLPAELRYCIYAADFETRPEQLSKWTSPIFMPRWASRHTLDVLEVRVERLQDISPADIRAEGVDCPVHDADNGFCHGECPELRGAFESGWDALNAKRGFAYATNPRVYVITFKRHRRWS